MKERWSWLQFAVLALILVIGIVWLSLHQQMLAAQLSQQQQEQALQVDHKQQQETLLSNYINTISDLMVHDRLASAVSSDMSVLVAGAQTRTTLSALDGVHKGALMRFLFNTRLITNEHHVLDLLDIDLTGAQMGSIDLHDTYLVGVNLSGANLKGANLAAATLNYTSLAGANLVGANLYGCSILNLNVTGASLAGADLQDAFNAGSTDLTTAKSLAGMIMPDGSHHR